MDNFEMAKKLAKEKQCIVSESNESLTEEPENLNVETEDMSRLISSLIEELEAVNFYEQRSIASEDESIINLMIHNRDEEIEHAAMIIEEIRKRNEVWNKSLKEFLFKDNSEVVEVEEEKTFTD
jgi:hypothetical protein